MALILRNWTEVERAIERLQTENERLRAIVGNGSYQVADADLTALAALSGTGVACRTATDSWATRTLTAPAAGMTIANPSGIAGDPTFALANDLAAIEALAGTGFLERTAADTWALNTTGRFNAYGGHDVLLVAGEALFQGEVVKVGAVNGQVIKAAIDDDMPVGTCYADIANGASGWITVGGVGYAKPTAAVTATRGWVIYVSAATAGRVDQAALLPAVVNHNREVGHYLYNGTGNGVATLAMLHWN